ncbi:SRPBCC family protein [Rhizobium sp. RAF56]|jgi:uncharacterized protein YndB with AHSA1/START domain|uniref:SRPBCC family protein n=1 Tax=Rhizobium sp. RAF56 TaxID=3233062 RepID=UPI003F9D9C9A
MIQLRLSEIFDAPVERVFAAWCDARQLSQWFAPGEMTTPQASIDPRPGGLYRIVMQRSDGTQFVVNGEYREVVTNERLRFSWQHAGERPTEVLIVFRPLDERRTELTLIHSDFDSENAREAHNKGWTGGLAKLRRYLEV